MTQDFGTVEAYQEPARVGMSKSARVLAQSKNLWLAGASREVACLDPAAGSGAIGDHFNEMVR